MDGADLEGDAWLTTREAAGIIGCGDRQILRLIEQGKIDAHKDESSYRVSLKSARAYKQRATKQKSKARGNGEGSVYETPKGSGKWEVAVWINVNGKPKRITRAANSQKEGLKIRDKLKEEFRQEAEAQAREAGDLEEAIEPPLVKDLCEEWLESVKQAYKENTLHSYRGALQRWTLPFIGDVRADHVTFPVAQAHFNGLAERYAPITVKRAHTPLNLAFEYAVTVRGYITKNVIAQVSLPKAHAKSSGIRLKVKELRAILKVADGHPQRLLIYFMAILGTRLCEGIGTYTKDFDAEDGTITINQQLQALAGSRLKIETPKTRSGIRVLPVPRRLSALLQEQISQARQQRGLVTGQSPSTNLIFLSEESTPLWPRNVERMFASIVEQAGLAEKYPMPPRSATLASNESTGTQKKSKYKPKTCAVCPQDLRRTVLTLLGDLAVDDATKARIAGHGPKNVTMRYDRGTLERMRAALQKLEDLILGEEETTP